MTNFCGALLAALEVGLEDAPDLERHDVDVVDDSLPYNDEGGLLLHLKIDDEEYTVIAVRGTLYNI